MGNVELCRRKERPSDGTEANPRGHVKRVTPTPGSSREPGTPHPHFVEVWRWDRRNYTVFRTEDLAPPRIATPSLEGQSLAMWIQAASAASKGFRKTSNDREKMFLSSHGGVAL